jgi:DNA-binding Lrp family transcriptional regulator
MEEAEDRRKWTLLTSHGHVLVEIARNPRSRVRDISAIIGITERATQSIIADLERAGYVQRVRVGRRTRYVVHMENPFRHAAQDGLQVGPFLEMLAGTTALELTMAAEENPVAEDMVTGPLVALPDPLAAAVSPVATTVTEPAVITEPAVMTEPAAIPPAPLAAAEVPEFPGSPPGGEYPKN